MRVVSPRWLNLHRTSVLACVALSWLLSACSHTPKGIAHEAEILPLSPQEAARLEQRVEALSRYAAGISDELNNRPSEATDQFLKAALADLEEEGLVLEVARRLIREQKNAQAVELLQKASESGTAPPVTYALLGLAHMQAGDTNRAIEANWLKN